MQEHLRLCILTVFADALSFLTVLPNPPLCVCLCVYVLRTKYLLSSDSLSAFHSMDLLWLSAMIPR